MSARKQNSTNSINEDHWNDHCHISYTLSKFGSRWKVNILSYLLYEKKLRYSELKARLDGISERMLIAKLKELEIDGLINRIVYPQVPPKVEYELTALGKSLDSILLSMKEWGETHASKEQGKKDRV